MFTQKELEFLETLCNLEIEECYKLDSNHNQYAVERVETLESIIEKVRKMRPVKSASTK
jgi:hypothetical protein